EDGIRDKLVTGVQTCALPIWSVIIGGPYDAKGVGDTPSRRKIFVCRPSGSGDEELCAAKILSVLAHRAYRRPVKDQDLHSLLDRSEERRVGKECCTRWSRSAW